MPVPPRCSVVVPTRNSLQHLKNALLSVRQQKVREIEIIVVDDGSTDGTTEWLRARSLDWPQLRIVAGDGRGPADARNRAIAAARAPLVAFLDADDLWWKGKLARQLAYHEANPRVGLSFTDYLHVDGDGQTHGSCFQYWRFCAVHDRQAFRPVADAEATLLGTNVVGTSTVVARLADLCAVGGFSTDLPSAEDWDLWLRIAARSPVAVTSAILTSYLINRPGNLTSRAQPRIDAISTVLARYDDRDSLLYRRAKRLVRARLAEACADAHLAADQQFRALLDRLKVLAMRPNARTARATAGQVRNVLRCALQPGSGREHCAARPVARDAAPPPVPAWQVRQRRDVRSVAMRPLR